MTAKMLAATPACVGEMEAFVTVISPVLLEVQVTCRVTSCVTAEPPPVGLNVATALNCSLA